MEQPETFSAFISHASQDIGKAEAICAQLEKTGFRCFIAPRDLRSGKEYGDEIIRGIEHSKCLVLVLSASANESAFVRAEVERAYSKGKPVFPIRIEEVLPSRALELFVSTQHWIDAWKGNLIQHTEKLAIELARDTDLDIGLSPEVMRRARIRRLSRGLGIVGLSLAAAIVVGLLMRHGNNQDISEEMFSSPPNVSLLAGRVELDKPAQATVNITDGYNQDGMAGVFENLSSFEVFEVSREGVKNIYTAPEEELRNAYQFVSLQFPIRNVPVRIVYCFAYEYEGERNTQLQGFTVTSQGRFASLKLKTFGPHEPQNDTSGRDCASLAQDYANKHLKDAEPLPDRDDAGSVTALDGTTFDLKDTRFTMRFSGNSYQLVPHPPTDNPKAYNASILVSFDGEHYEQTNLGQQIIPWQGVAVADQKITELPDYLYLKASPVSTPVKVKIPLVSEFERNMAEEWVGHVLDCDEISCKVGGPACFPYIKKIQLVSNGAPVTGDIRKSRCGASGQDYPCTSFPWDMPALKPGQDVAVAFTLSNGEVATSAPVHASSLVHGKWRRLAPVGKEDDTQAPPVYLSMQNFSDVGLVVGVPGSRLGECRGHPMITTAFADWDGRGELPVKIRDRKISIKGSIMDFPDHLTLSFEYVDGKSIGPISYRIDADKLIDELLPGEEIISIICPGRVCTMPNFHGPDTFLSWRNVADITYGPTADDMNSKVVTDVSVASVREMIKEGNIPNGYPHIEIPQNWRDFFYSLTLRDGSKTRLTRLKLH